MRLLAPLVMLLVTLAPGTLFAQSERVFLTSDLECGSCNLTAVPGDTIRFYVMAASSIAQHVTVVSAAEFRIVGLPADWTYSATPAPYCIVVDGDPLERGASIGIYPGQQGQCVLLFTIDVMATSSVQDVQVRVERREPPTNPNFPCPRLYYDCGPCDIWTCAEGGTLRLNSETDCVVAVSRATWSGIKALFQ